MPIRIAIVEDDSDFRNELAEIINSTSGMKCTGGFGSAEEILKTDLLGFDLVLMDINLPRISGIGCVFALKGKKYSRPIIMLTVHEDSETLFAALQAGAVGYLLKRTPLEKIIESIQIAHDGGSPMTPQIARRVVEHFHNRAGNTAALNTLTVRERDVLERLARGRSYKQLAAEMDISIDTVRHHIRHIYDKLQVNCRTEATLKFLKAT
jgi:DNA-binding NarL/FixJ family response regulator